MCGIVGALGALPGNQLRVNAVDAMRARGPDGHGHWTDVGSSVWLGHRRLSIQDVSEHGAQPMQHPDREDLVITYNGEIYNYRMLRKELEAKGCRIRSNCDTELLLHAYSVWGKGILDHIQGMFAFVIWDGRAGEAFLARDPVGQKPFYYRQVGNAVQFASTPAALRVLDPGIGGLSSIGLGYVLTLGYVPSPHSIWQHLATLPPGHCASWSERAGLRIREYWSPPDRIDRAHTYEGFGELLAEVCGEHMIADVPVGLLLSGGLDSTCIAKTLVDSGFHDVEAVTLGFAGSDKSEADIASETAQFLGLAGRTVTLVPGNIDDLRHAVARSAPEPQGYSALLTWYAISAEVSKRRKVVMSGDGGDELFGGYGWYRDLRRPWWSTLCASIHARVPLKEGATAADRARAMRAFADRSLLHRHAMRLFPRFLPEEAAQLFAPLGENFDEATMLAPLEKYFVPKLPAQAALQRVDLMTFCSGSILAKTDHMSMAHSLEVRAPLLDRRLVDWALSRRTEPAIVGEEKRLIRTYLNGAVPEAVLSHPKQGFSVRGMESFDFEALSSEIESCRLVTEGILRKDFARYVAPGVPYQQARLWTLAAVAAWFEHQIASN